MIYKTSDFINANRLDVIAKYIYVKAYMEKNNLEYATELYKNMVLVTTKGAVIEPGSFKKKHNMQGYINEFNSLIDSFSEKGFDASISRGSCGAHRAACLLYFGQQEFEGNEKVFESYADCDELRFDADFFQKNIFKKEYLVSLLIQYIDITPRKIFLKNQGNILLIIEEDNKELINVKIADDQLNNDLEKLNLKKDSLTEFNKDNLENLRQILIVSDLSKKRNPFLSIKYKLRRLAILTIHCLGNISVVRKIYPSFKYYS